MMFIGPDISQFCESILEDLGAWAPGSSWASYECSNLRAVLQVAAIELAKCDIACDVVMQQKLQAQMKVNEAIEEIKKYMLEKMR